LEKKLEKMVLEEEIGELIRMTREKMMPITKVKKENKKKKLMKKRKKKKKS